MDKQQLVAGEILALIDCNIKDWRNTARDIKRYHVSDGTVGDFDGLTLTIAVNSAFTLWNYQTGDNSYTGGAYSLPHWAVVSVYPESTITDIFTAIMAEFDTMEALEIGAPMLYLQFGKAGEPMRTGSGYCAADACAPRNNSATGYGSKIPTSYRVAYEGRLYRVYCACWSNVGSLYAIIKGERVGVIDYNPQ